MILCDTTFAILHNQSILLYTSNASISESLVVSWYFHIFVFSMVYIVIHLVGTFVFLLRLIVAPEFILIKLFSK